ncbi:MAG: hypothetical protein ABL998_11440 [Planctomycetota bacterium]
MTVLASSLVFFVSSPTAQSVKLNGPLAREVVGDVRSELLSPDGTRVVYQADQERANHVELFSVPAGGGPSVRLSAATTVTYFGHEYQPAFTPDSSQVVYIRSGLWVVPATGGAPLRLDPVGNTNIVTQFWISGDGSRVVYKTQVPGGIQDLHSVPIGGGASVMLAPDALDVALSADSTLVIYLRSVQPRFLSSIPITGGSPLRLDASSLGVRDWLVSPDDSRVVYRADTAVGVIELYSTPTTASAPVRLNGALVAGGSVGRSDRPLPMRIDTNSTRVVYLADQEVDERHELYSVPLAGGAVVKLNGPLVAGGDVAEAGFAGHLFDLSPNGARVVYLADQEVDERHELFSVPLAGGAVVKLSGTLAPGERAFSPAGISPDSSRVVFDTASTVAGRNDLYSAPLAGGPRTWLAGTLDPDRFLSSATISADSSRVVFLKAHDLGAGTAHSMFSVPLAGGPEVELDLPLLAQRSIAALTLAPDSSFVVFRGDQDVADQTELFQVPISGGPVVRLNPRLAPGTVTVGDVKAFRLAAHAPRVLYRADQEDRETQELHVVDLPHGRARKVNAELVRGGDVTDFALSADGETALYLADQEEDETQELFARPLTAPAPLRVNPDLVVGGDVTHFRLSPNGARLVYRADQEVDEHFELFTTLGGAPTKLHETLPASQSVEGDFAFSDEGFVVMRVSDSANDVTALRSVALDGGPSLELSLPLPNGRKVTLFQLIPDGLTVVYLADANVRFRAELYRVPVQGGTSQLLSGPLVTGGTVLDFTIPRNGQTVVYRALQDSPTVLELYGTPLQGGAWYRLSAPIAQGFGVGDYTSTPDGAHVLYLASEDSSFLDFELRAVPSTGGTATRLDVPSSSGVVHMTPSPDSASVVYSADGDLWQVPLGGGAPVNLARGIASWIDASTDTVLAHRPTTGRPLLAAVPLGGGAVRNVSGSPVVGTQLLGAPQWGAGLVVYRSDEESDGVEELFVGFLTPPRRRR